MPTTDPTPYEPETRELQQLGVEVLHGARDIHATLAERPELYDVAIVSRPHIPHDAFVVTCRRPSRKPVSRSSSPGARVTLTMF